MGLKAVEGNIDFANRYVGFSEKIDVPLNLSGNDLQDFMLDEADRLLEDDKQNSSLIEKLGLSVAERLPIAWQSNLSDTKSSTLSSYLMKVQFKQRIENKETINIGHALSITVKRNYEEGDYVPEYTDFDTELLKTQVRIAKDKEYLGQAAELLDEIDDESWTDNDAELVCFKLLERFKSDPKYSKSFIERHYNEEDRSRATIDDEEILTSFDVTFKRILFLKTAEYTGEITTTEGVSIGIFDGVYQVKSGFLDHMRSQHEASITLRLSDALSNEPEQYVQSDKSMIDEA